MTTQPGGLKKVNDSHYSELCAVAGIVEVQLQSL